MIKLFSNKTNSPKIKVESKFLINKTTVNTSSYVTGITKNDLLFIKLTFSGLQSAQKASQLMLYMMCYNAYANTGVKVIKCNSTDISNSNIKSFAQSITGEEEVLEKTIIYGRGHSLNKPGDMPFSLDLTNILKDETNINPTIMMAISFPYGTTSDFGMYSPEALAKNSEICIATMTEVSGLSGLYKYDEHDFGRCGKVSVNLATGKLIYSLDVMTSVGKKFPINFSLYQNTDKSDSLKYFRNKVIPNFHYRIYSYDDDYVVEDPTGFKNFYKKVEYTAENKDEVLKNLGIKHEEHLTNSAILYQSHLDYSYMYVQEGSTESIVHLYDKADTCISFIVSLTNARISTIETSIGSKLTYTWNSTKLEKITNSDGEEMLVDYNSERHIQKISFPSIDRYIDFTEDTTNQTLNIRTYYKKIGTGSSQEVYEETINEVKLYFSSNVLIKILDVATGYYLSLTNNAQNQVTSAGIYNASGTTKNYVTTYTYSTKFTKATDLEGNSLFYHFDNYGRIKTIMDNQARTITYNYDEFENGESKNLIGLSKTQNNSRNLLENHSFEDENAFSTDSIAWKKTGNTNSKVEILTDGVLGEKCLKLTTVNNGETSIHQSIVHPKSGNYVLKGFIKHPNVNNLTSSNVKVGIKGTYQVEETVTVNVNSNTTTTKTNTVTYSYNEYALLDFEKLTWYSFETPVVSIPAQAHHITMTVELVVNSMATEIYLDDLQLTNSSFFTRYNLIENGYMEFADSNNRPHGWSFENLDNEDAIAMIEEDNIHSSMLGNHVMRIAPGDVEKADLINDYKMKRMFKSIPITGLAGEQFIFSVFAKGCVTTNIIFRAFIKFIYENKDPVYSQFDFDKHFDNWQMLTRSVVAEDNFTEVVVGIEYDGGAEVLLDCFQLYKDSFGKYYNYDSRGNITETISGDGTAIRISYDDNNKIDEIYSSDGSHFKYNYDSKGRLSKVTDLNGNKIDLAYDSNDRIITTTITQKNGERIINSTTYDDVNNQEKTINEFGKEFTTSMDYLNRVISQMDSKGLETEFTYNHKSELEQLYAVVDDVTNKNSFTYDSFGNTKTIRAENGTFYSLTYDTFGRLEQIKCNGYNLERYQYDSLVNGYKKGQLLKKTLGTSEYYEFSYNDLGQVTQVKLNGELIATYSYDENGNVYELKDEKANVSSYFTYDLQGNLIKKKTNKEDSISYTYDNVGNIQKVSYNLNSVLRSIDYEYEYELNEYTKEGYFNRLATMFGDEIIVSGHGPKGQFGAKHIYATYSSVDDDEMGMKVFHFVDKYDFINYEMDTFNSNRTSGVVNGKIYSKKSWDSRFRYNKTFYMFIKPTGSYAKENLFTFGSLENQDDGYHSIEIFSHLCVNSDGKIAYYPADSNIIASTDNTIKLNEWNLVGIKLFKKDGKHKAQIILNNRMTSEFEISENVDEMNYLLVANQYNLITNDSATTSSGGSSITSNLVMPFKVCLMSYGAYDYTKDEFTAIYNEGLKYLFKGTISKSNATIYYDEKAYKGFDVITLNGSLESTKGLKPVKIATIDKSYRFDKTRIFKYDEELQKHVFGCYDGIVNLTPGTKTALAYKLPLTTEGTIALRFKYEERQNMCYQIFSLNSSASDTEYLGLYIDDLNELKLVVNNQEMISTNTKIIGNKEWHHFILRFKNNKLQVYLDELNQPLFTGTQTVNFTNKILYLGNDKSASYPLNGCIEMFAFKDSFASDEEMSNIFEKGKTITIRNQLDSLGRVTKNKIFINEDEYETTYGYYKTHVISQTFSNDDKITYSYDAMNNIISKTYLENGVKSQIRYTYDQLGRLIKETYPDGKIEKFTYNQNGNIQYREVILNDEVIVQEEYSYHSTVKDRLLKVKDLISGNIVQNITYDSKNLFHPSEMIIKGAKKSLKWNGKRLIEVTGSTYEYNSEGIRTKKITPNETTTFELEESNIIQMNKVTSNENVILNFVYDASSMLVGLSTSEGNYFYMRDITGNIIGLIDQEGEYVVKYTYNAWGKILEKQILINCIASRHNPFVYKGYFIDEETELYYCNSRYYSPELCRWISPDSIEYLDSESINGLNLYAYCGNDPVNRFDPSGHAWEWSTFWTGLFMVGTAITAIALSVTTFGAGIPLAMSIVAGVTLGAGVLTGINGVATMIEAGTDYNFVRDGLFNDVLGLSDSAYDIYADITEGVAAVGSMILGFYHTTGQYKAAKASQQYLGKGYTKADKNRWVSADGYRQVRWDTTHHMYKGKPSPVHFNWYEYQYPIAPGVRNKLVSDIHVWLKWFSYYM